MNQISFGKKQLSYFSLFFMLLIQACGGTANQNLEALGGGYQLGVTEVEDSLLFDLDELAGGESFFLVAYSEYTDSPSVQSMQVSYHSQDFSQPEKFLSDLHQHDTEVGEAEFLDTSLREMEALALELAELPQLNTKSLALANCAGPLLKVLKDTAGRDFLKKCTEEIYITSAGKSLLVDQDLVGALPQEALFNILEIFESKYQYLEDSMGPLEGELKLHLTNLNHLSEHIGGYYFGLESFEQGHVVHINIGNGLDLGKILRSLLHESSHAHLFQNKILQGGQSIPSWFGEMIAHYFENASIDFDGISQDNQNLVEILSAQSNFEVINQIDADFDLKGRAAGYLLMHYLFDQAQAGHTASLDGLDFLSVLSQANLSALESLELALGGRQALNEHLHNFYIALVINGRLEAGVEIEDKYTLSGLGLLLEEEAFTSLANYTQMNLSAGGAQIIKLEVEDLIHHKGELYLQGNPQTRSFLLRTR